MKYPVGRPSLGPAEVSAVTETIQRGWITQGATVLALESALAQRLKIRHVVACSSGTAALHLALVALGITEGDEVIVPDLTYVATANAVLYVGATPVLVDVDPVTWCLSTDNVARHLTKKTKAVIPVHLYGVPCEMECLQHLSEAHDFFIVEDAAEAIGASWHGQACGTLGHVGTFSFYANKIMTTGEGGAVVTNHDKTAETLRLLRGQAQSPSRRFYHSRLGFNYRMTDLQASLGVAQEQRLDEMLVERRRVVDLYRESLDEVLYSPNVDECAPWLFTGVSRTEVGYGEVEAKLADEGIETRPVFVPLHRLPMYEQPDDLFPVSCSLADYGVSLPTWPELSNEDVEFIAGATRRALC